MDWLVSEDHDASYPDPIRLQRGSAIILTGRTTSWEGHAWLWAVAEDGREGWIPDGIISRSDLGVLATTDYSAKELTCRKGDRLEGAQSTHGWVWCRRADGHEGWVPLSKLTRP